MKNDVDMVVGVDYSMNCPGICVCHIIDGEFKFENCSFAYITSSNNWNDCELMDSKIIGYPNIGNDFTQLERQVHLSNIVLDFISDNETEMDNITFAIEDYAFSRAGQLATLGENAGILKYRVYEDYNKQFKPYSPSTIKSFARTFLPEAEQTTDKGKKVNMSSKEMMHYAFKCDTGVDLCKVFGVESVLTKSGNAVRGNPIGDIVDAYFIAKYHFVKGK